MIYPEGSLLRVTVSPDNWDVPVGTEFVVDEYIPAEKSEGGVPFYWGSRPPSSGDLSVPADCVALVKTAEEMAARKIPTRQQVMDEISLELLSSFESFDTDESVEDGEASREVYGKTADGLPFAFKITVESVWETDL